MPRVVINTQYGGFSLSPEAFTLWASRKGLYIVKSNSSAARASFGLWACVEDLKTYDAYAARYPFVRNVGYPEGAPKLIASYDIPRDDEDLVDIVASECAKANGAHSTLTIVEIPDDVKWHFEEYDGWEWVAEDHRTWKG